MLYSCHELRVPQNDSSKKEAGEHQSVHPEHALHVEDGRLSKSYSNAIHMIKFANMPPRLIRDSPSQLRTGGIPPPRSTL